MLRNTHVCVVSSECVEEERDVEHAVLLVNIVLCQELNLKSMRPKRQSHPLTHEIICVMGLNNCHFQAITLEAQGQNC